MKTLLIAITFAVAATAQITICEADPAGTQVKKNQRDKPICMVISADAWQAVTASRTPIVGQPGTPPTMAENSSHPTNWAWLRAVIERELQQVVSRYPPPAIAKLRDSAANAAKAQADAVAAAKETGSMEQ